MFNNDEILVTLLAKNTNCSNLLESKQYLQTLYLQDNRPWVVAFSGGKDSTLVLQLVCEMLLELGDQANKKVFIISSDTRVEAPNVSAYLSQAIQAIREYARNSKLDLETHLVKPDVEQTFWSKLIGHGYPSFTYPLVPLVYHQHENQTDQKADQKHHGSIWQRSFAVRYPLT
jgi:3'-phosphoadenosine 5'-phosphosulfate sulfotransferase (PAPS reductase)/FAD synthetase